MEQILLEQMWQKDSAWTTKWRLLKFSTKSQKEQKTKHIFANVVDKFWACLENMFQGRSK